MRRVIGTLSVAISVAISIAIGVAIWAIPSVQAGPKGESQIQKLRLGEYWFGAEVKQADLVGKVVLVEIWGS